MKRIVIFVLVSILVMGACMAEEAPVSVCKGNIFRVFGIEPFSGDSILLSGLDNIASSDTPGARIAVIDPSGEILWEYKTTEGSEQTRYNCAVQVDEDTIAALLDLRDQTGYIDFIEMDGEIHRSELLYGPHKIFANDAGILVNILWEDITHLIQMDKEGNTLWAADFEGTIYFDGILQGNDCIYAYGHEAHTDFSQARLVVLSTDGEVLKDTTDENKEAYIHGTIHEGQILLLGGNAWDGENWDVSCFNPEGSKLWYTAIPGELDGSAAQTSFRSLSTIIPYREGFLIAAKGYAAEGSTVILYEMDANGTLLDKQELHAGMPVMQEGCMLLDLEDGPYIVIQGWAEDMEDVDFWDDTAPRLVDLAYGLYIQKVVE